jgi:hypothetical protein
MGELSEGFQFLTFPSHADEMREYVVKHSKNYTMVREADGFQTVKSYSPFTPVTVWELDTDPATLAKVADDLFLMESGIAPLGN